MIPDEKLCRAEHHFRLEQFLSHISWDVDCC